MNFKSFKLWLNIITIGAFILLIVLAREQIVEAIQTFETLNLLWLSLLIPLQLFNHFSVAKFYQSYLKTLNEHVKTRELYKVSLEMNFVNNVFPSGGVSGFGYLSVRLKKLGIKGSKSTLLQTFRHLLTFVSFIVFLMLALSLLSIFGSASRYIVMLVTTISMAILFTSLFLVYIISDEGRIKQFTAALPKLVNAVVGVFRKKSKPINISRIEKLFGELHDDYSAVRKNWRNLRRPFMWTMLMNLSEILTIFVVYLSFGSVVNPGAIIIAYAVANIAGLVAILPGGVGIYEGLMTAVMASAGVNKVLALSATVVYRVTNMAIFLPLGYIFYSRALKTEVGGEIEALLERKKDQ